MIVAAAIRYNDTVYSLPAPKRHHDIIHYMVERGAGEKQPSGLVTARGEQGFIDANLGFVGRIQAADIAIIEGQITRLEHPPQLYSEDLW